MINIRLMNKSDVDGVREADLLAFSVYQTSRPLRTKDNILSCLELNPEGCFIAEKEKIVGYIFSRMVGKVGWIGVFGVAPEYQGKGIGRTLLLEAYNFLNKNGCSLIGLETMPFSPYNIGLYLKFGFSISLPTLIFCKKLDSKKEAGNIKECFYENEKLEVISQISRSVLSGLDYKGEVKNANFFQWGKTIIFGSAKPVGFCILKTSPVLENQELDSLYVNALVVNSVSKNKFIEALKIIEHFAVKNNFKKVTIPVNMINAGVAHWLLEEKYQVQQYKVRMIKKGNYNNLSGIELSRWSM